MRNFLDLTQTNTVTYDEGLKTYMDNVYKYMSIALLITGLVSFIVAKSTALTQLFLGSPLSIVVALAPLFYVFYFSAKVWSMTPEKAKTHLFIFSGLMGLSMSSIFYIYTSISIVRTFFITAAMFGGMSLYGYVTKKDLTGMGQFLIMGLLGIVIASLVNIFLKSSGVDFAISILGVIIFSGLTAYDVQKIKQTYDYVNGDAGVKEKVAVIGALNLYMDFINLFLTLLKFFGNNKN